MDMPGLVPGLQGQSLPVDSKFWHQRFLPTFWKLHRKPLIMGGTINLSKYGVSPPFGRTIGLTREQSCWGAEMEVWAKMSRRSRVLSHESRRRRHSRRSPHSAPRRRSSGRAHNHSISRQRMRPSGRQCFEKGKKLSSYPLPNPIRRSPMPKGRCGHAHLPAWALVYRRQVIEQGVNSGSSMVPIPRAQYEGVSRRKDVMVCEVQACRV